MYNQNKCVTIDECSNGLLNLGKIDFSIGQCLGHRLLHHLRVVKIITTTWFLKLEPKKKEMRRLNKMHFNNGNM